MAVESRASSSSARSGPSARSSTSRANSTPPTTSPRLSVPAAAASSPRIASVVCSSIAPSLVISRERLSISSWRRCWMTSAARSAPSAAISTAAFRRPPRRAEGTSAPRPGAAVGTSDAGGSWIATQARLAIALALQLARVRSTWAPNVRPVLLGPRSAGAHTRASVTVSPPASSCATVGPRGRGSTRRAARPGGGWAPRPPRPRRLAEARVIGSRPTRVGGPRRDFAFELREAHGQLELAQPRRFVVDAPPARGGAARGW